MDLVISAMSALSKTPLPTILVILGGVFLLLAVVDRLGTYVKMTRTGKWLAAGIGVPMLLLGIGLYTISTQPAPAGSTTAPATAVPCLTSNMGWVTYLDGGPKSTLTVIPVQKTDCASRISFDLKAGEWLATYKKLEPNLLLETQGIGFSYSGTGARNTLEFKLVERDANGNETVFGVEWSGATSTAGKTYTQQIHFADLNCRPGDTSRCPNQANPGQTGRVTIRPELVDRMDFTVSNHPESGDMPGQGDVTITGLWALP